MGRDSDSVAQPPHQVVDGEHLPGAGLEDHVVGHEVPVLSVGPAVLYDEGGDGTVPVRPGVQVETHPATVESQQLAVCRSGRESSQGGETGQGGGFTRSNTVDGHHVDLVLRPTPRMYHIVSQLGTCTHCSSEY